MGMPITVELVDAGAAEANIKKIFAYFTYIDETFSPYKEESELMRINRGELAQADWSDDMKTVFALAEETKNKTNGYFDIRTSSGAYDPSGLVKGWSIYRAAQLLERDGFQNFYIEAGGDVQVQGKNGKGAAWSVGIRNPFQHDEIVKVLYLRDEGVATSGTYLRGQHIYDPHHYEEPVTEIVSLTVLGPNVYEADRFATAAFAMRRKGIDFIERLQGFEGYLIDGHGIATMTSGLGRYLKTYA